MPWFLSVSTPILAPTPVGLPASEEIEKLDLWEQAVEGELSAAGKFVFIGRVTWNGHRELLHYVAHCEPYTRRLQSLLDSDATRPFGFGCERDDDWEAVNV